MYRLICCRIFCAISGSPLPPEPEQFQFFTHRIAAASRCDRVICKLPSFGIGASQFVKIGCLFLFFERKDFAQHAVVGFDGTGLQDRI